MIYE
jgi:hypothetical protein